MRSFSCTLVLLSPVFALTVGSVVTETYQLDSRFAGATFLDNFDFFTGPDPTNGFVNYVTSSYASTWGLTRQLADGSTYIGVDYENILVPYGVGRDSVRISSAKSWGTGTLVVVDLAHVPGGQCGTWPAMWMLGPNWPYGGEIDIIEGVNSNVDNLMSLHTSPGCTVDSNVGQLGTHATTVCDTSVNSNSGCGVDSSDPRSYGTSFNTAGGGIYATQITPTSISIWFFPRTSIPSNLHEPSTSTWGLPQATFSGCDIESHFSNLSLVFDTTFCGDWAGAVWGMDEMCAKLDSEGCVDFVAGNPGAFGEAFWAVNFVEVYTLGVATMTSVEGSTSSSRSATRTSSSSVSSSFSPSSSATRSLSSSSSKVISSTFSSVFGPTITKSTATVTLSSSKSLFKSSSHSGTTSPSASTSKQSSSTESVSKSSSHSTPSSSSASTSKKSSSSTRKSSSSTKIASTTSSLKQSSSSTEKSSSSTKPTSTTSSLKNSSSSSKVTSSSSSNKLSSSGSSNVLSSSTTKKPTTSSLPSVLVRRSTQAEIYSSSKHAALADSYPENSAPQTPTPSAFSNRHTTSTIPHSSPHPTSPPPTLPAAP